MKMSLRFGIALALATFYFPWTQPPSVLAEEALVALEQGAAAGRESKAVPAAEAKSKTLPMLESWGTACDPDGDCKFYVGEDELVVMVPGSERPHDLAADIQVTNAPRVTQQVKGEFTLQVRIDGRFAPGGSSTQPGRTPYNGAGLIAMLDENNVVTLARAVLQHGGGKRMPYANFEIRINGELQRIGLTSDFRIPDKGPVYLRIERRGQTIRGSVSTDGETWTALASKELPEAWPHELQVGVAAISTSKEEFLPRFSRLQLLK